MKATMKTMELAMKIRRGLDMGRIVPLAHESGLAFIGTEAALMASHGATSAEVGRALNHLADSLGMVAMPGGLDNDRPGEWFFIVPEFGAVDCLRMNHPSPAHAAA